MILEPKTQAQIVNTSQENYARHDGINHVSNPIAEKRGIAFAAQEMGITETATTWVYTIVDTIHNAQRKRFKALNKANAKLAYWWGDGEQTPTYWHHECIKHAIASFDGLLYIAAGEPDFLTFIESGQYNVLTWFGEASVPATLADDLLGLGVNRVLYAPDLDKTGKDSAIKVRELLRDTNIFYEFKQLPEHLGTGADTNDLWLAIGGDREQFLDTIHNAPDMDLPALEPKIERVYDASDSPDTPEQVFEQIKARLGLSNSRINSSGLTAHAIPCLFHEDKKASAGLKMITDSRSKAGGMYCQACGWHNWKDVAEKLGIDIPEFKPSPRQKKTRKHANIQRRKVPNKGVLTAIVERPKNEVRYEIRPTFGASGLPKHFLAATMFVSTGRGVSKLANYADTIIKAAASGGLPLYGDDWSVCAEDIAHILNTSIDTLYGASGVLQKLIDLGYMVILTPIDISKNIGVNTPLLGTSEGKIPTLYQVNNDRVTIASHLLEAIQKRLKEYYFPTKKTKSNPNPLPCPIDDLMYNQLDLDTEIIKITEEFSQGNKQVQRHLKDIADELRYWRDVLDNPKQDSFFSTNKMNEFETDSDIRIALMKPCIGKDLYSKDVKRIIGTLSNGTLNNTRKAAKIKTVENIPQSALVAISEETRRNKDSFYQVMNEAIVNAGNDKQGRVVETYLQIEGQSELVHVSIFQKNRYGQKESHNDTVEFYRQRITGVCFGVQTASTYVEMTEDDIKEVQAKKAEKQAKKAQETNSEADSTETEKQAEIEAVDYPITDYNPVWLRQTIALWYELFTDTEAPQDMTEDAMIAEIIFFYHTMTEDEKTTIQDKLNSRGGNAL